MWIANIVISLGRSDGQANLSLCWAHKLFSNVCHALTGYTPGTKYIGGI